MATHHSVHYCQVTSPLQAQGKKGLIVVIDRLKSTKDRNQLIRKFF